MKCATIFLTSVQVVFSLLFRAPVSPSNSAAAQDSGNSSAAEQALEAVASLLNAHKKPERLGTPTKASVHRAKVDLGFTDFQKDLAQRVEAGVRNATEGAQWTPELRQTVLSNISGSLNATLSSELRSVKMSIGQTWVGLPDQDQQDEYVSQLRSAFAPILSSASGKILSHFGFGVKRVQRYEAAKLSPGDLAAKSERALLDALVNERCYGDSLLQVLAAPARRGAGKGVPRFCVPPQLFVVAGNLNDTQGLVSMGFKFEAHALALVQIA